MGSEWQGQPVTVLGVLEGVRGGAEGPSLSFLPREIKFPGFQPLRFVWVRIISWRSWWVEPLRSHRWTAGVIADPGLAGSQRMS